MGELLADARWPGQSQRQLSADAAHTCAQAAHRVSAAEGRCLGSPGTQGRRAVRGRRLSLDEVGRNAC